MSRRTVLVALAVLTVAAAACSNIADADFESSEEPTAVVVTAGEGDVTIRANTASGTEVRWDESDATPTASIEDGVLTVSDDCESACRVDYTILVGDAADVSVQLRQGNVSVSDVDGTIAITVTEGNVSLNTLVGTYTVVIEGEGDILGARLEGTTGSFTTETGSIDVTFDTAVTDLVVRSEDGDVTAQLAGGPYAVDAAGDSVDVLVDEDATAASTVAISTGKGDVTVYKK